jgi:hypothetical protein
MGFKCNQVHFTYQGRSLSFGRGGGGGGGADAWHARLGEQNRRGSKLGSKVNIVYEQFYFLPQNNLYCVLRAV